MGKCYLTAVAIAVPVGAIAWFELVYLSYGITGNEPTRAFNVVSCLVAFGAALAWPLCGVHRPAEVVRRACHVGTIVSVLLPVVAITVLLLWVNASGRPDLGMGGLMLYSLPVVAVVAAFVLALIFGLCGRYAARRLRTTTGR